MFLFQVELYVSIPFLSVTHFPSDFSISRQMKFLHNTHTHTHIYIYSCVSFVFYVFSGHFPRNYFFDRDIPEEMDLLALFKQKNKQTCIYQGLFYTLEVHYLMPFFLKNFFFSKTMLLFLKISMTWKSVIFITKFSFTFWFPITCLFLIRSSFLECSLILF